MKDLTPLASLNCDKNELKNLSFEEKTVEWQDIHSNSSNITLSDTVKDKVVVIIDDLYQFGISMWSYAEHLKMPGQNSLWEWSA